MTVTLDDSQRAALSTLTGRARISIVTGGPGTGKTTLVRALLSRLHGQRVALGAPTGKAAKRMQEATGVESKTLHRLLGYSPAERGFYYGAHDPLPFDVVIVDEASMIDTELGAHLLEAIHPRASRIVLVGDANQLPSVGPGALLRDLVNDSPVPCARLTTVHRSASGSWICTSAPRVLAGEQLDLEERDDFRFVNVNDGPDVPRVCGNVLEDFADAQILVPQSTGKAGAEAINVATQARFNPLRPGEVSWGKAPHELRPRDRVIHTRNNYDLGVFNGEVGVVESIDKDAGVMRVAYPDRAGAVEYSRGDSFDLRLAYALTIHKSQGSEWPWVVVVCHAAHSFMLTRQLLYTAITRGKRGVVLVGNERGIANALKKKTDAQRNTALCDRIRGEL